MCTLNYKIEVMKNYILITIIAFSLASCGEDQEKVDLEVEKESISSESTGSKVNKSVTRAEFETLLKKKDAQLIDVRTPKEYTSGHIENAINIDYYSSDFKSKLAELDRNKPVLVYCKTENRTRETAKILKELGFNEVYTLEGGFTLWD